MMTLRIGEKEYEFGTEITIETDGKDLTISDGEQEIQKSYESPLEILYVMSWFMRAADKTKLIMKAGESEFVRKRHYRLGKLRL